MTRQIHQVLKNCGNFSTSVVPGMIAYGRENGKDRDENATDNSPIDGYITQEADIQIGGFLYIRCAREASAQAKHLSDLDLEEKQRLVLNECRKHLENHGPANHEFYGHWLKRVRQFAKYRNLSLPEQGIREAGYQYFHRLRKWTEEQPQKWPALRSAAGTHLVLSPEPKLWSELRSAGVDERQFLRSILTQTMKEFGDWRRKIYGPGHSLGWVAGTHVQSDGAARHPHIHLVVLKRDEAGREVDWSVSALKHCKERGKTPDPLHEVKRLFRKNVEKAFERVTGKNVEQSIEHGHPFPSAHPQVPTRLPHMERMSHRLKTTTRAMRLLFPSTFTQSQTCDEELGAALRLVARISKNQSARNRFLSLVADQQKQRFPSTHPNP